MTFQSFTPPEPDVFDVDEQEAEIADRLHKERQEARAWDAYDKEES